MTIPDLHISIDSNEYPGLVRIVGTFSLLDKSTGKEYHRAESMREAVDLHAGVIHVISLADKMMDAIAARNAAMPAELEPAPQLGAELFALSTNLMKTQPVYDEIRGRE